MPLDEVPHDVQDFFLGPASVNLAGVPSEPGSSSQIKALAVSQSDDGSMSASLGSDESNTESPLPISNSDQRAGSEMGNYVAFGSIRLHRDLTSHSDSSWHISACGQTETFPNERLCVLRHWLRHHLVDHPSRADLAVARIYLLPEDVDRAIRSSPKPFRKTIKWLISIIDRSSKTWTGDFDPDRPAEAYGIPSADQDESLFYIFNTLKAPSPDSAAFRGTVDAHAALDDALHGSIPGITTELYPYQRKSVAMMLQREEDPYKSQDPRKPSYIDLEGNSFYMDVFSGSVTVHPQLYVEPRGGILAETMGYGKTLVCIALILATRGFYPRLPEARIEETVHQLYPQTPSLLSAAARAVKHHGVPWKAKFHALRMDGYHYDNCLTELDKYQREFGEPIFNPTTPDRKVSKRESDRTLRLCSATLVVVPPNLIVQWQHEIKKHTELDALDVLVIDMSTKEIPSWRTLMDQDIVLISKNRLDVEYRDDDLNQGKRLRGTDRVSSQLTELRWLRVVCDEGHSVASSASRTRTMAMLDKLSVERRWIISGTPSSSLVGVDVTSAVHGTDSSSRRGSFDKALERRRLPDSLRQEERDLDRLRLIVVNFFKMQPWANQKGADTANWKQYLAPFNSDGSRRCAASLRPLLQSLMVRHRIKDIDSDITLPPLHNRTVYLEPSYYDKLALNLFVLVLTANAITSERVDQDYMHHPNNRKTLELLISNLRQSTFHWVGFTPDQVKDTIKLCETYFDKHLDEISDDDGVLLTQAISHAQRTLADDGWRAFSKLHEIGVYVKHFPKDSREVWSLHAKGGDPLLLGTLQAREAQTYIRSHISDEEPTAGLIGTGMRAMRDARERADEDLARSVKRGAKDPWPSDPDPSTAENTTKATSLLCCFANHAAVSGDHQGSRRCQIVGFSSAKLTYICTSILSLPITTKCLIFYDSNNTAFWLAEALELLGIEFLIYANTLPPATRAKYLSMFNSEPRWRMLLMDLRQASTGLHVASASRVWIVTPIWRREVEAQAIKRAHRIGQVNEVFLETLVLKGTIEEKFWRRRKGLSEGEVRKQSTGSTAGGGEGDVGPGGKSAKGTGGGAKSMQSLGSGGWLEDDGVVEIIKQARFLDVDYESTSDGSKGCCRLQTPVQLFVNNEDLEVEAGEANTAQHVSGNANAEEEPPRRKKAKMVPVQGLGRITGKVTKGVRFADDGDGDASIPASLQFSASLPSSKPAATISAPSSADDDATTTTMTPPQQQQRRASIFGHTTDASSASPG
ncbi:F-box protein [Cyphellophora attinorum]|uniref:F-box protein n=1 Tax=Cyphellophora attinorum TaxID=1664694 RepID=A0A0N1HUU7_9EURO|nr:F-box protein [Phialophora attinorum]KPI40845.1 F-box protein [Phialophora attinorum]